MRKESSLDKLFKALGVRRSQFAVRTSGNHISPICSISPIRSASNVLFLAKRQTVNGERQTVNCAKLLWWKSLVVQK